MNAIFIYLRNLHVEKNFLLNFSKFIGTELIISSS